MVPAGWKCCRRSDIRLCYTGCHDGKSKFSSGTHAGCNEHIDLIAVTEVPETLPGTTKVGEIGPCRHRDVGHRCNGRTDWQSNIVTSAVKLHRHSVAGRP